MRSDLSHLDQHVIQRGEDGASYAIDYNGVRFTVIASWGMGRDHVSISNRRRVPSYDEMCWFKSLFFEPDETAMQLHVGESDHLNWHDHCLHLWRPQNQEIPKPPLVFV